MIPSANLFKMASSVIGLTPIEYHRFSGRTVNSIGLNESSYYAPVVIRASVQALDSKSAVILGLDLSKKYVTVYSTTAIADVERATAGDYMVWNGRKWQCIQDNDWHAIDGWKGVLFVDVGAA